MSPQETLIPTGQLVLQVTIRIDVSNITSFLAALRPVWKSCISEPECIFFDVSHSPTEPGTFRFVEVWKGDQKWFEDVQLKKEYYTPYVEVTRPMWVAERELVYTERVEGWSYAADMYLEKSIRE
jgi:quinol monooxygenase YgiN